jgi:hypothetical protein
LLNQQIDNMACSFNAPMPKPMLLGSAPKWRFAVLLAEDIRFSKLLLGAFDRRELLKEQVEAQASVFNDDINPPRLAVITGNWGDHHEPYGVYDPFATWTLYL